MYMKEITHAQFYLSMFVIIVAIAFINTNEPIWTVQFLKVIGLNITLYFGVSVIALILVGSFFPNDKS